MDGVAVTYLVARDWRGCGGCGVTATPGVRRAVLASRHFWVFLPSFFGVASPAPFPARWKLGSPLCFLCKWWAWVYLYN